jgi:hypothetical protein
VRAVVIGLQFAFIYLPPMQQLFGATPLDAHAWALVLALSAVKFAVAGANSRAVH